MMLRTLALLSISAKMFGQGGLDALPLLREVADSFKNLETFRAEGRISGEFELLGVMKVDAPFRVTTRGARMRIEEFGFLSAPSNIWCDGNSGWIYDSDSNTYRMRDPEPLCAAMPLPSLAKIADDVRSASVTGSGHSEFEGKSVPCEVVEARYRVVPDFIVFPGMVTKVGRVSRTMCIDRARKLVLRDHLEAELNADPLPMFTTETITYERVERNPTIPPAYFEFEPPAGSRLAELLRLPPPPPPAAPIIYKHTGAEYDLSSRTQPEYTQEAWDEGIQGIVILTVRVHADGSIGDVVVMQSLGYGLDEKAIECARKWKYSVATTDGRPVDGGAHVEIGFALPDVRPPLPTPGGVSIPTRPARLKPVELADPTDLDKFLLVVGINLKAPEVCRKIDPMAGGGGAGFSRRGEQVQTMRSECLMRVAGRLRDPKLCEEVKPIKTYHVDGSLLDSAYCAKNLAFQASVGTVFDPHFSEVHLEFFRKLSYDRSTIEKMLGKEPYISPEMDFLRYLEQPNHASERVEFLRRVLSLPRP